MSVPLYTRYLPLRIRRDVATGLRAENNIGDVRTKLVNRASVFGARRIGAIGKYDESHAFLYIAHAACPCKSCFPKGMRSRRFPYERLIEFPAEARAFGKFGDLIFGHFSDYFAREIPPVFPFPFVQKHLHKIKQVRRR